MPLAMHAIASQEYLHSRMNKIEEAMSSFSSSTSTPLSAVYFVYLFKIESLAIIFLIEKMLNNKPLLTLACLGTILKCQVTPSIHCNPNMKHPITILAYHEI
ncbi:hypothetical protein AcW2_005863 [Taiwanofungus camphoratus]|nr:hypothetical protein AcW2_005863 [Antrodia cinnamomea]